MPALNPTERGQARVANAAAAQKRIDADLKAARPAAKQLAHNELRKDGEMFARHSCVIKDEDWSAALASADYFGKYVTRLRRLDQIEMWAASGTKYARVFVVSVDTYGGLVQLHVVEEIDVPAAGMGTADEDAVFRIEEDLGRGYLLRRKSDGVVIVRNIRTFDAATVERRRQHDNRLAGAM